MGPIAAVPHSTNISPSHNHYDFPSLSNAEPSRSKFPVMASSMSGQSQGLAAGNSSDAMVEGSAPSTPAQDMATLEPAPSTSQAATAMAQGPAFTRARSPPTVRTSEEADDEGHGGPVAGSSRSPSVVAQQRRTAKTSTGSQGRSEAMAAAASTSSTLVGNTASTTEQGASSTEDDRRGRSRSRQRRADQSEAADGATRSRTPSPILGSIASSRGHLSFGVALEPTTEEVRMLLYGEDGKDEERPADVSKAEMDGLEKRLDAIGLASTSNASSREAELAAMAKKILHHSQLQDHYIDSLEASLHGTRLRSISTLSSMRTSFAHSFAAEYELRARLEAELEDTRAQARKLSAMLARSENRNEENDRQRAASAEEEVLWQEEMKDHASAYAQQQAARARAAQLTQKGQSSSAGGTPAETPSQSKTKGLDDAFQERAGAPSESLAGIPKSSSDNNVFGLGISSPSQPAIEGGSSLSPLSTIIKERNKLLADKKYLKARSRDAEAQRDRLEVELKSLRPLLVRGAPSKKDAAASLTNTPATIGPVTPSRTQKRDRSRRRRQAVLGDAEAEHLLLAARRLNNRPKEEPRPHTPPIVPSSVNPRTPKTPRTSQTPRIPNTMDTITQSAASTRVMDTDTYPSANASPLAMRSSGPLQHRWSAHQRVDSNRSIGGIDDLLQAAQTVLTPGERRKQSAQRTRSDIPDSDQEEDVGYASPTRGLPSSQARFTVPAGDASPKRRRVSGTSFEPPRRASNGLPLSPDKSVFNNSRRLRTSTEGAEPFSTQDHFRPNVPGPSQASAHSALDLLADQATQSQQPSLSSDHSGSGEGEPYVGMGSEVESEDGMHIDHDMNQMHGMPPNGAHYYPRGAYGHPYAHPPPMPPAPMSHDAFRMMPGGQVPPYGYGPSGSPVSLSSQGWTSQNIPASRNGLYSPPSSQPRFALQSGPRITTGNFAAMGPGGHPLANSTPRMSRNGDHHSGGSVASDESGEGEMDDGDDGSGRTPQKGGNTSPDKRLPYVRWSDEEDAKLRKAIDEYGQRWELVARAVESRTYHQCRQRYLLMRRKDAAAREGMALSAAHSGGGGGSTGSHGSSGSGGRPHSSSSRPPTVSSPAS